MWVPDIVCPDDHEGYDEWFHKTAYQAPHWYMPEIDWEAIKYVYTGMRYGMRYVTLMASDGPFTWYYRKPLGPPPKVKILRPYGF
jgi:hypothetical protein